MKYRNIVVNLMDSCPEDCPKFQIKEEVASCGTESAAIYTCKHKSKCATKNHITYEDIYNEFCDKFPNAEVEDYRPADPMYIPQLLRGIPNAIVVWLKDGSKVVYIAK
jgi:hypothetical protein